MRFSVIYHAFTVEIGGNFADAFVRQSVKIDVAGIADFPCGGFLGAGVGSLLQALLMESSCVFMKPLRRTCPELNILSVATALNRLSDLAAFSV